MKRVAGVLLSLFLVCGGVAWALATCLRDHADHLSETHHSHSHAWVSFERSREPAGPLIHCPFPENQVGPAAQSGPTKLRRMHGFVSIHAPFFHTPGSVILRDSLWMEAVFRGILTFSFPNNLGRHLILSVLRI
jgi:hypothetical protein